MNLVYRHSTCLIKTLFFEVNIHNLCMFDQFKNRALAISHVWNFHDISHTQIDTLLPFEIRSVSLKFPPFSTVLWIIFRWNYLTLKQLFKWCGWVFFSSRNWGNVMKRFNLYFTLSSCFKEGLPQSWKGSDLFEIGILHVLYEHPNTRPDHIRG